MARDTPSSLGILLHRESGLASRVHKCSTKNRSPGKWKGADVSQVHKYSTKSRSPRKRETAELELDDRSAYPRVLALRCHSSLPMMLLVLPGSLGVFFLPAGSLRVVVLELIGLLPLPLPRRSLVFVHYPSCKNRCSRRK